MAKKNLQLHLSAKYLCAVFQENFYWFLKIKSIAFLFSWPWNFCWINNCIAIFCRYKIGIKNNLLHKELLAFSAKRKITNSKKMVIIVIKNIFSLKILKRNMLYKCVLWIHTNWGADISWQAHYLSIKSFEKKCQICPPFWRKSWISSRAWVIFSIWYVTLCRKTETCTAL